jgi:hypothetical protein
MHLELYFNEDLIWQSDWNGYEVGYEDVEVVGLYGLKHSDVHFYIDMDTLKILEAFAICDCN